MLVILVIKSFVKIAMQLDYSGEQAFIAACFLLIVFLLVDNQLIITYLKQYSFPFSLLHR